MALMPIPTGALPYPSYDVWQQLVGAYSLMHYALKGSKSQVDREAKRGWENGIVGHKK